MRHRIAILLAGSILVGLFCAAWLIVTGPLASKLHSASETFYAVTMIMIVCISIVTGVVVGAWDASKEVPAPRKHLHHRLRPVLHR
jgi:hypothetical protein